MALPTQRATVAFGANLGDRDSAIYEAMAALSARPEISEFKASRLYRTKPVDATGPDFCNAAAQFQTSLDATTLLHQLLEIERDLGRTRSVRNAPRTIDLDLIALGDQVLDAETLTLPHPRAHQRAFVLIPLCEIDDTVMLGPNESLRPASQWLGALNPSQRAEVAPW